MVENGFLCYSIWKIQAMFAVFFGSIGSVRDREEFLRENMVRIQEKELCFF